ncbi:ABC transporter ATP-binding protein [Marinobacter changyiensis]|uniref:ABC transporter ATP-binding protein n=1 Tax=Marinobacter changyiensis TaxID=2604091 RepID=UPI0012641977|nr:ABC transporter ATP-binding protein [Marinobacter changyiensis]
MGNALEITGLVKTYGDGFEALRGIDLHVAEGDFFALLGPNGAGKSTTLGIVCSLVNKSSGSVKVFGHDIDTELSAAKLNLGVVPQEFNFNQFEKVFDIVTTQAGYYGIPLARAKVSAERYLRKLGLWEKRDSPARMLSGGMKRRLMIARALVHEPKLLILDEPTAGVDIELRRSMWTFLEEMNRQGTTIILTTHYLEEAEALCRNIAIIDHGKILKHTSKRALLQQLSVETFILDTDLTSQEVPQLQGFATRLNEEGALEVDVEKAQSLNGVFVELERLGIKVLSMRTKANRLEELFLRLVEDNARDREAQA